MNEPKVLTRMRLSCCWGDNLNEKELNEVVDYINYLQNNWNELKKWLEEVIEDINKLECPDSYDISEKVTLKNIVKKMQELEGNNEQI